MKLQYYRVNDETPEDAYSLDIAGAWESDSESDMDCLAEMCANDFFYQHDGWECSWPVYFAILDETGKELGKYSISCESVPEFTVFHD